MASESDQLKHYSPLELSDRDVQRSKTLIKQGSEDGQLSSDRIKIQLLGDSGAGKTSLRKNLMGENFNQNEERTEGIDVQQTFVDEKWRRTKPQIDYFKTSLFSYIGNILYKERIESELQCSGTKRWLESIKFHPPLLLLGCFFRAVYRLLPLRNKASLTVLVCTPALCLFVDKLSAYRMGGGFMLYIVSIDVIQNACRDLDLFSCTSLFDSSCYLRLLYMTFASLILGIAMASGFRTGLVIAFCIMMAPKQDEVVTQNLPEIIEEVGGCFFGAFICILILNCKLFHVNSLLGLSPLGLSIDSVAPILWNLFFIILICLSLFPNFKAFATTFISSFAILSGLPLGRLLNSRHDFSSLLCLPITVGTGFIFAYFGGLTFPSPYSFGVYTSCLLLVIEIYRKLCYNDPAFVDQVTQHLVQCNWLQHETLPITLNFWDFAGDEIYYSSHQAFIAKIAIFLLVFDVNRFLDRQKWDEEVQRLVFWLHSICMHANSRDSLIFMVGTHIDAMEDSGLKRELAQYLKYTFYVSGSKYCNSLVINKDNTPLFLVENSRRDGNNGIKILQEAIMEKSSKLNVEKNGFPIRWRCFIDCVSNGFKKQTIMDKICWYVPLLDRLRYKSGDHLRSSIVEFEDTFQQAKAHCNIRNEVDMKDMLKYFHQTGDLIYIDTDPVLSKYIVLNPQVLIDAMGVITNLPEEKNREPHLAQAYLQLEQKGILHSSFLDYLLRVIYRDTKALVSMLLAYDFICKIEETDEDDYNVLVPSMRKTYEGNAENLGHDKPYGMFYFDFGFSFPNSIFNRLASKCVAMSHNHKVYSDVALFNKDGEFSCRLKLLPHLPEQHLIEVVVKTVPGTNPFKVLGVLNGFVEEIRERDYANLEYTCGVLCQYPGSHENCQNADMHHILPLASPHQDIRFPWNAIGSCVAKHCNGNEQIIKLVELERLPKQETSSDNTFEDQPV